METILLAASLRSRENYQLVVEYIDKKSYSRPFQIILGHIGTFYNRDQEADAVGVELLEEVIRNSSNNNKHVEEFLGVLSKANEADVSETNLRAVVLDAKRKELGEQLATAIVSDKDDTELLAAYVEAKEAATIDDLDTTGVEVYEGGALEGVLEAELSGEGSLHLYPQNLGERVGKVGGGDHILIFARPETGKTALCMSISGGFARQGARGIYIGNEDRMKRLILRQVSNLTGLDKHQIADNPDRAYTQARSQGLDNITFLALSPGTPQQIEKYIKNYSPQWVIVDQVRNLFIKSESRTNQLEAAATAMRNIGKKYNCVMVSVTQAGDSADGKEILQLGDVDYSNTGMQATADVMIGMGMSANLEQQGLRMLSLCKNKLEGDHAVVAVRINPTITRITSV